MQLISSCLLVITCIQANLAQEYDYEEKFPKTHIIQIIHHHHHPLDIHGHYQDMRSHWPPMSSSIPQLPPQISPPVNSHTQPYRHQPPPPPQSDSNDYIESSEYPPPPPPPMPIHYAPHYTDNQNWGRPNGQRQRGNSRAQDRLRKWWNNLWNRGNGEHTSSSTDDQANGYPNHNTYDPYFSPPPPVRAPKRGGWHYPPIGSRTELDSQTSASWIIPQWILVK